MLAFYLKINKFLKQKKSAVRRDSCIYYISINTTEYIKGYIFESYLIYICSYY